MAEERSLSPGSTAGASPGGGDPSMEDILASIRRILNEDEPGSPAPVASGALTLTEDMLVAEPEAAVAPQVAPDEAPVPADAADPIAVPLPFAAVPPPMPLPVEALLAPAVAAAASASIGTLFRAVAQDRDASVTRGGPSIEDVVREELRPLLKAWLDQYLPEMVERLVRDEIERVVRRGLG